MKYYLEHNSKQGTSAIVVETKAARKDKAGNVGQHEQCPENNFVFDSSVPRSFMQNINIPHADFDRTSS